MNVKEPELPRRKISEICPGDVFRYPGEKQFTMIRTKDAPGQDTEIVAVCLNTGVLISLGDNLRGGITVGLDDKVVPIVGDFVVDWTR